jgi:hypothetical protein
MMLNSGVIFGPFYFRINGVFRPISFLLKPLPLFNVVFDGIGTHSSIALRLDALTPLAWDGVRTDDTAAEAIKFH